MSELRSRSSQGADSRHRYSANPVGSGGGASAYRAAVMADSPISYWRLGELTGTAAADNADSNTGTYTGGFTLGQTGATTSDLDRSVGLNGSTGYVTVPHKANLVLSGDFTLEAWVNPTDFANYNMIVTKCSPGGFAAPFVFYLVQTTGNPVFAIGDGSSNTALQGTVAPPTGAWRHVAVTVAGTTLTHYLNGVANGTSAPAQARADTAQAVLIGRRADAHFFKGGLDEVAIYPSALSAARLLAHFNAA